MIEAIVLLIGLLCAFVGGWRLVDAARAKEDQAEQLYLWQGACFVIASMVFFAIRSVM